LRVPGYPCHTRDMNTADAFAADLAKMNARLIAMGALVTYSDGFQGFDPSKAPAQLLSTYQDLVSCGYANGWI
jgi:hypothetical protein